MTGITNTTIAIAVESYKANVAKEKEVLRKAIKANLIQSLPFSIGEEVKVDAHYKSNKAMKKLGVIEDIKTRITIDGKVSYSYKVRFKYRAPNGKYYTNKKSTSVPAEDMFKIEERICKFGVRAVA